jgi:hypothetical protein
VRDVRFSVPVFEGAHLWATVTPDSATAEFAVTTDQLEPPLAISGTLLYGTVPEAQDDRSFVSRPERQLFSLEETIGLLSAMLGVGVQESGGRVLYMSQSLELHGLITVGERLKAVAGVAAREPGKRLGEKISFKVAVSDADSGKDIVSGESLILYAEGRL